jgi:hypothetical protein
VAKGKRRKAQGDLGFRIADCGFFLRCHLLLEVEGRFEMWDVRFRISNFGFGMKGLRD